MTEEGSVDLAPAPLSLQHRRQKLRLPKLDCADAVNEVAGHRMRKHLAEKYDIGQLIGQGTVGRVYRAACKSDGKLVAIKQCLTTDSCLIDISKREYEILRDIQHPNVVKSYDFVASGLHVALVLEYFDGHTLHAAVESAHQNRVPEATAQRLFRSLLSAVEHLHMHDIIHRDIKPENVLVDRDLINLKLCDLNTARKVEAGGCLSITGTMLYAAPEVLLGEAPGKPADVWGTGQCLYFMLSGSLPQCRKQAQNMADTALRPVTFKAELWSDVSASCRNLISHMLTLCAVDRATACALTEHEWVASAMNQGPLEACLYHSQAEKDSNAGEIILNEQVPVCDGSTKLPVYIVPSDLESSRTSMTGTTACGMSPCSWMTADTPWGN